MGQGPEDGMVMWECQDSSSLQNKSFSIGVEPALGS